MSSAAPADGAVSGDARLAARLAHATAELVGIPSVSHAEQAALDFAAARFERAGVPVRWNEARDVLVAGHLAGPGRGGRPLLTFAGHLDTVPPQNNDEPRIEDGRVHGLGSTDMKGACAVFTELLCDLWASRDEHTCAIGAVLFAREELPFTDSALNPFLAGEVAAAEAEGPNAEGAGFSRATDTTLAIVMEPTLGIVQGGCLGNLNATIHLAGRTAHSARPWQGQNALDETGALLTRLAAVEPVRHEFSGLEYAECITAVGVRGGSARNVVPGSAEVDVNYRYPPGVEPADAEAKLLELVGDHGQLELIGHAPSGAVTTGHPLAQALIAATQAEPEPKQAWTPVAEFTAYGVDAVNFGPGDPALAHQAEESVEIERLVHAYRLLDDLARRGAGGTTTPAAASTH